MTGTDWGDPDWAEDGTWLVDDDFLVLFNASWEPLDFVIPQTRAGVAWQAEIDRYDPAAPASAPPRQAGDRVTAEARQEAISPRPLASAIHR